MNKRITSILLCIVMIVSMLVTAVPVFAEKGKTTSIKLTADKTTAEPGDIITFTVTTGAVKELAGLGLDLRIPSDLTFVSGSGKVTDGLMATMAAANIMFTESSKIFMVAACNYTSAADTVLMTFQCKVNDGTSGNKTVELGLVDDDPDNCCDLDYDNIAVTFTPVTVQVTVPHTHVYDQTSTDAAHLKTPATCTEAAVYYKSCTCGENGTETFTSGSALGHDYTKKVENNTYLKTAASNCTEYNVYWYACSRCDANAKDDAEATDKYYTSTTAGNHSFTEKIEDAAHYVAGTGTDCQSVKKYYFDCAYCDQIGTTTWDSTTYGPHNYAATWSSDADGHWHECSLCHDKKDNEAHTPGAAATETTPQKCTKCDYIITPALGHTHHMTPVAANPATCTEDGNKAYYVCSGCSKWFEDATGNVEITDHSSVVLPKTGHSYTVQKSDEAHKRSTAADCREFDTYWYTCANDETHSAKDDAAAADKFYNGEQGAHVYGNEWVDRGEAGHAHKCQYHDAYDEVQPHTPDHEGGATYDYAVKCTECGRVLEPQRVHGSIRVEVPFKLTVKKTGEMAPGQETFKFAVEKFGAPTTYTVVQDTVETNGEKTYEGKFIFTIRDDQAGNLSEGFVIRQVKGNAAGWTYDETMFYAVPLFVDSYESVGGWSFFKFDQNNGLDHNNPLQEIGFTNSFNAKMPVTPPAPETPKTGDGSMMGLSIALVIVSGAALMGTALYSRRKSR